MLLDTIFVRTRNGALALNGQSTPLSGGFRQFLRLVDGQRDGREVLAGMAQLDEEDFGLWAGELLRQGLIAPRDELPVDEMAFGLTVELPVAALDPPGFDAGHVIDDIMADVGRNLAPVADTDVARRLSTTGRMAVIESVRTAETVGKAGYFVYPDAADGLPAVPRVCIVGHVAAQNRVLELMFARFGIKPEVVTARNDMRSALGRPDKPHILVVDAQLPMLDAFRTLDAMRVDSALGGVRVVLVSDRGERADLAQAMMLGAAAYIVKPLRKEVLDAALPQLLGRAARRA